MAAYNGQQFIASQLESILNQLAPDDEVIVIDDASTDCTSTTIENLRDVRLRLSRHESNQGILRTFEAAIQQAQGEFVFLADQDDIWANDKIRTVLDAFRLNPDVDIVVSDAALIGRDGSPLSQSYYAIRGRFKPGILANVFRCSYLGCTMAFRSHIRSRVLPFPKGVDLFHDLWIGTANCLFGGRTLFVDRPLVQYRRHDGNMTGNRNLRLGRQIRIRWDLCRSLGTSWLTSKLGRTAK